MKNKTKQTQDFMQEAILQARKALKCGEVPIGAVIVQDGKIIAKAHNTREKKQNALCHAETICIAKACKKLKSWRLENCEMFVTLEPCPMCAGAIANARIKKVVYAAEEKTAGDNLFESILTSNRLNHKCKIEKDESREKECSAMLTEFFKSKR